MSWCLVVWLEPEEPGRAVSDVETSAEKQTLLFSIDSNLLSPSRWKMRHSVFPVEGPFFYYNNFLQFSWYQIESNVCLVNHRSMYVSYGT